MILLSIGLWVNIVLCVICIVIGIMMMSDNEIAANDISELFEELKIKHLLFLLVPGVLIGLLLLKAGITLIDSFDSEESKWNRPLRRKYDEEDY